MHAWKCFYVHRFRGILLQIFFFFLHSRSKWIAFNNVVKYPCAPVNHTSDNIKNMLFGKGVSECIYIFCVLSWFISIHSWLFAFRGISKKHIYIHLRVFVWRRVFSAFLTYCYPSAPYFIFFWKIGHWKTDVNEVS